jgi:hypothetical protein
MLKQKADENTSSKDKLQFSRENLARILKF